MEKPNPNPRNQLTLLVKAEQKEHRTRSLAPPFACVG